MHPELEILVGLAISFSLALVMGYATQRLGLSPIVGYLLTGIVVSARTPGYVGNQETAAQFAELGVVLLMFGVGIHFNLRDLMAVRRIAVAGATGQILAATVLGAVAMAAFGWPWSVGLVTGLSVSVASTVVLIRMLTDNDALDTQQGHIAVGWLIVEDLFTVLMLVILPTLPAVMAPGGTVTGALTAVAAALLKVCVLGVLVLWGGRKVVPWILLQVARTRSRELFTLATLAIALAIATGSAMLFGVSVALGAFLAGTVVGQSEVSHQAAADALPMRDAFAVLFFVSVGMLFDPSAVMQHPGTFLALLGVILLAKPLSAVAIVWALGHSVRTALTVAIGLAQIGEFSFILAALGVEHHLMSPAAQSLLVASAIATVAVNPLLFRAIPALEAWLRRHPRLWRTINRRAELKAGAGVGPAAPLEMATGMERAVIVGYGPVGAASASILKRFNIQPVIIDLNVDAIAALKSAGELAIFGDAAHSEILTAAGIQTARYLLVTVPDIATHTVVVIAARELNPDLKIFVRAHYLQERAWLEEIGVSEACYEEAEAALGLATLILREVGADEQQIRHELNQVRATLRKSLTSENGGVADSSQRSEL